MNISRQILLLALTGIAQGAQAAEAESAVAEPTVFIEQAAQISLADVEAARLALARSEDTGVRALAERILRDQVRLHEQLQVLATSRGIATPSQLDATHQAMLTEMTANNGTDFDRKYALHVSMGHDRAVALFEAARNSLDPVVSDFALKTLPTLREHRELSGRLAGKRGTGVIPGGH